MKFINKAKIISLLPQIIASLFLVGFAAWAWQEPPVGPGIPPGGNVDPPINTGRQSD